MAQLDAAERQLLMVLRNQLIPWAENAAPLVLLGVPPRALGTSRITEKPGHQLSDLRGRGQKVRVQSWKKENLNALAIPYLGCVVEGEADIVSETTEEMCRRFNVTGTRWVLRAPATTFIMTPPGIPVSSGERPHWEGEFPDKAYSRIMWMQFQRTGVCCHFCTSSKGKHWSHPDIFVQGTDYYPLAQKLIHEMHHQSPQYLPLVYHHLSSILHYVVRGLLSKSLADPPSPVPATPEATNTTVQQAIDFINDNFNRHTLTVSQIASHLHLSPRHLARLFQQETGTSVIAFVYECRMNLAVDLLMHSEFNIRKVGGLCGYGSTSSFVKAFLRHFGVSPTEYRQSHKPDVRITQQMAVSDIDNT